MALLAASLLLVLLSHPLIHGDGVAYLIYLGSPPGDGGFVLSSQVAIFAPYIHTAGHTEGGGIAEVIGWLIGGPHGPTLIDIFRDRYGPWAKPEL